MATSQTLPQPSGGKSRSKGELSTSPPISPLLLKTKEVCKILGGIHPRSLSRLEKSGAISSVHLLRHKLYAAKDVENLVEGLRSWKA